MPLRWICLLLLGAWLLPSPPARAELAPGEAPYLDAIEFEGNAQLDAGTLRSAMRLKEPSWFRPLSHPRFPGVDFLAGDLASLVRAYRDAGHPLARIEDAVVRYDEGGEHVTIVITVDEGPRVRLGNVGFRGLTREEERAVRDRIRWERGEDLSERSLEIARSVIEGHFRDRGHALVKTYEEIHLAGSTADVAYRCDPGPPVYVDSISIGPLVRTKESAVRGELTLEPGSLLTPKGLLESRRRLAQSGIFRSVRVEPVIVDSTAGRAVLRVSANERRSGWVGGGFGFSSADQLRFLAETGLRNVGGVGRRLSLNGELFYSLAPDFRSPGASFQEGLVRVDFLEPRVFHTKNRATLSAYLRWLQEQTFHERIFGYAVTAFREISLRTRASVTVDTRLVSTTEAGVEPDYTTRLIRLDLATDHRDNPFDATAGHFHQAQADYAGGLLGGTNEFGRLSLTWQGYRSPRRGWVFAARVRGGYLEPFSNSIAVSTDSPTTPESLGVARVPWEERFRLGGSNTVRGYPENDIGLLNESGEALGGLVLVLANLEARFPLLWILQGGVFIDLGNVWTDPERVSLARFIDGVSESSYDPLNVFYGMGGGLRIVTPVGPVRLDYGFKVGSGRAPGQSAGELHFGLGQAF